MTKVELLNTTSEEEIYKRFVPGFIPGKNCKSPFSEKDNNPSFSTYKSRGKLLYKSHNTGHGGDVFQLIADLNQLDVKKNFPQVIDIIVNALGLNGFSIKRMDLPALTVKNSEPAATENKSVKTIFEERHTAQVLEYFKQFSIDEKTLIRYNVKQVRYHEFISSAGKTCKFDYIKRKEIAICYTVNERIKIYLPQIGTQKKDFPFKEQTSRDIFGYNELQECDLLFIAAGEKDCLVLNANGFASVSFQSELHIPTKDQIELLNSKSKNIIVVYDNDENGAGKRAAEKICSVTKWNNILLPDDYKDVAEFFIRNSKENFKTLIPSFAKANQNRTNQFINIERFLSSHYDLRYNEVSNRIEEKKKQEIKWKDLNENNIWRFLMHNNISLSMAKLSALLRSDFVQPFNPFREYFNGLPSYNKLKEPDHITTLCSYISAKDQERFTKQLEKHLVRCVACATDDSYYNKQAFIIVHEKQNSGKSTFCRWLCPPLLEKYFGENVNLTNKDGEIALSEKFIINLDELAALTKYEINQLKSVMSKDKISLRRPFDRSTSDSPRRCTFFGSTNRNEFLFDETGSVRWLCFRIESINYDYKKDVDINRVWAQAHGLYKAGFEYDLTFEEIQQNEIENNNFFISTPEEDLLQKMYLPGSDTKTDLFMTTTDILQKMQESCNNALRLNTQLLGRILHKNGFVKTTKRLAQTGQPAKGYFVKFSS